MLKYSGIYFHTIGCMYHTINVRFLYFEAIYQTFITLPNHPAVPTDIYDLLDFCDNSSIIFCLMVSQNPFQFVINKWKM